VYNQLLNEMYCKPNRFHISIRRQQVYNDLFYTGHILIQMHLDASVCAIPFLMSNEKKFAFYSVSSFMFPIILTIYCQVYLSVFHQTFSFFSFPRFYYCSFSLPHFASKMSLVFLLTIWGPNLLSVHRSHRVVFG